MGIQGEWQGARMSAFSRLRGIEVPRPRLMSLLSDIPSVFTTVVKAGAGYGKTTAVRAYLTQSRLPARWFTVREQDKDSVCFVERFCSTVLKPYVDAAQRDEIIAQAHSTFTWIHSAESAGNAVQNAPLLQDEVWVVDNFHLLDDDQAVMAWFDCLHRRLPPSIHMVIVTRTSPCLPFVESLTLADDALWIQSRELAFTEDEIGFLFHEGTLLAAKGQSLEENQPLENANQRYLQRTEIREVMKRTGGMAMVLSMLLRDWMQHGSYHRLRAALSGTASLTERIGRLFLEGVTTLQQEFLRNTSLFPMLHPDLCNQALHRLDSELVLSELEKRGHINLSEDGISYELHPLVRDYLLASLSPSQQEKLVETAILWHLQRGEESRAVSYLFFLSNKEHAGNALAPYIHRYLHRGQISTVRSWLDRVHLSVLESSPALLHAKAEMFRHVNQFSDALELYQMSEEQALIRDDKWIQIQVEIGRARLYLDTIQPAHAHPHILAARQLVPRKNRVLRLTVLQLALENSINSASVGRANRIAAVLRESTDVALSTNNMDARMLLRTGKISEVITLMRSRVQIDGADERSALAHREGTLLLSLMYVMRGEIDEAQRQAEFGHGLGQSLHSPFVSAVGFIRLGHAEHLADPLGDRALNLYQQAVSQMDDMEIPRGKSEAFLGLCLAHGYRKQYVLAKSYANEGIRIAEHAGDIWMASLVRLGFGQAAVINGDMDTAAEQLTVSIAQFQHCTDAFLETAARIWRALALHRVDNRRCHEDVAKVLCETERRHWGFLLERPTYCGLRDVQSFVPLLRAHRVHGMEQRRAVQLLDNLDSAELDYHPGYTLRVQTLGGLRVWRGFAEIAHGQWPREKARQLFLFLLTHRGVYVHREEVCEQLWGDLSPDAAERDFKVALHALSTVLEPDKPGRGPSVFIARRGSMYALTKQAILQVDKDNFKSMAASVDSADSKKSKKVILKSLMALYQGEYLPEAKYELWCEEERTELRLEFIQRSMEYANLCYADQEYEEALAICERIVKSELVWEDAYILMMKIHGAMFNRSMIIQTYHKCEQVLRRELGVEPMPATTEVFQQLV
ncbi:BTAD domain-containing putative transcriptional regulator [Alicyclobacillus sp. SO9]|uniref:BTAD domain-containing putative transcriptional regulator n=1 Tax=Alicyclobacillus sp. SO9 TaxID=2665646 RepID=UPI0018E8DA2C|nr:BTAD domain-containing putative transcriptional regulator [Alicyclobacillus sp. SO9]QQE77512.1 hypothetical protein GI364_16400 [Alicyclobacillus sp. SO9]